jgi:hypothetical protein
VLGGVQLGQEPLLQVREALIDALESVLDALEPALDPVLDAGKVCLGGELGPGHHGHEQHDLARDLRAVDALELLEDLATVLLVHRLQCSHPRRPATTLPSYQTSAVSDVLARTLVPVTAAYSLWLFPLLFLAGWRALRRRHEAWLLFLLPLFYSYGIHAAATHYVPRYSHALVPAIVLAALAVLAGVLPGHKQVVTTPHPLPHGDESRSPDLLQAP